MIRGLLVGMAVLVSAPLGAAAKCTSRPNTAPGVPIPPPLVIIDGRQTSRTDLDLSPLRDSIQAVSILCWNTADSTFSMAHGGTGLNVIWVVTTSLVDRVTAELHRVSALGLSAPGSASESGARSATEDRVVVELTADGTQWSATLRQGALVHRCVLEAGRPAPSSSADARRGCSFSIAEGETFALRADG